MIALFIGTVIFCLTNNVALAANEKLEQPVKYNLSSGFSSEFSKKSLASTQANIAFSVSEIKNILELGLGLRHVYKRKEKESIFGLDLQAGLQLTPYYHLQAEGGVTTENASIEDQSLLLDNTFSINSINYLLGYEFANYSGVFMHTAMPGIKFNITPKVDLKTKYSLTIMSDVPKSPLNHTVDLGVGVSINDSNKLVLSIARAQDTYIKSKEKFSFKGTSKIGSSLSTWWGNKTLQTVAKASLSIKDSGSLAGKVYLGLNLPL